MLSGPLPDPDTWKERMNRAFLREQPAFNDWIAFDSHHKVNGHTDRKHYYSKIRSAHGKFILPQPWQPAEDDAGQIFYRNLDDHHDLPRNWEPCKDEEGPYYFNYVTRDCTKHRPGVDVYALKHWFSCDPKNEIAGGCFGRWLNIVVFLSLVCIALYYLTQWLE